MKYNRELGPEDRSEDMSAGLQFRESPLGADVKARIRRLRRKDKTSTEIAALVGCHERFVVEAIGAMRGRRQGSNHRTLSVNNFAGDWMRDYQKKTFGGKPAEAMWQTMNRLIEEFEALHAEVDRHKFRGATITRRA